MKNILIEENNLYKLKYIKGATIGIDSIQLSFGSMENQFWEVLQIAKTGDGNTDIYKNETKNTSGIGRSHVSTISYHSIVISGETISTNDKFETTRGKILNALGR